MRGRLCWKKPNLELLQFISVKLMAWCTFLQKTETAPVLAAKIDICQIKYRHDRKLFLILGIFWVRHSCIEGCVILHAMTNINAFKWVWSYLVLTCTSGHLLPRVYMHPFCGQESLLLVLLWVWFSQIFCCKSSRIVLCIWPKQFIIMAMCCLFVHWYLYVYTYQCSCHIVMLWCCVLLCVKTKEE